MLDWITSSDLLVEKLLQRNLERQSLHSQPRHQPQVDGIPFELAYRGSVLPLNKPRICISILLLIPILVPGTRTAAYFETVEEKIVQQVQLNRGEGKWQLVKELLALKGTFLKPRWEKFAQTVSSRDYFGNWEPLFLEVEKYLYSKKMYQDPYFSWSDHSRYRVKKKVYRRGYDDKGSRRPDHLWLPENAYSREEKDKVSVKRASYRPFELYSGYSDQTKRRSTLSSYFDLTNNEKLVEL